MFVLKFVICVDVDGVINDLMEKTLNMHNEKYGSAYTEEDIVEYDLFKSFPYEHAENMIKLFKSKELWDSLKPVEKSQWGVKKLVDSGYDVYFATATDPINFAWKVDWLKKYFPFVKEDKIIKINNKGLLNCDILIDDSGDQLLSNKGCYRVCFNKPWNASLKDEVYGIRRANNWHEVVTHVCNIYDYDNSLIGA